MDFFTYVYLFLFFFGLFFLLIFLVLHYRNLSKLYSFPEPKRFPSVTFLVPAYNEEASVENTVNALVDLDYPKDKKRIIIINDGSKDKTAEISRVLAKKYAEVELFDKANSGKADSLNQALKKVTSELFAVVDADSYPKKDALMKMVGYFEEEGVAAVTSRVLVKNKQTILGKFQVLDYSIIAWTRKLLDFVDSVYVTNGPLSVYRVDAAKKVGGFDTKNLTEDIEITWHLLSTGHKTRMSYNAIVYTTVPESLKIWIKQRVRWNLGGIQTIQKYWRVMFKQGAFGYFVVPYVSASFILAILGFILLLRYLWIKVVFYSNVLAYASMGYQYWKYVSFSLPITILLIFAVVFFVLAIFYYKQGFKHSETGRKSILSILVYSFFYRSLYVIPLIIAIYKLAKGDIGWYTK